MDVVEIRSGSRMRKKERHSVSRNVKDFDTENIFYGSQHWKDLLLKKVNRQAPNPFAAYDRTDFIPCKDDTCKLKFRCVYILHNHMRRSHSDKWRGIIEADELKRLKATGSKEIDNFCWNPNTPKQVVRVDDDTGRETLGFYCPICTIGFADFPAYRSHLYKSHKLKSEHVKINISYLEAFQANNNDTSLPCPLCPRLLKRQALRVHFRKEHSSHPIPDIPDFIKRIVLYCTYCGPDVERKYVDVADAKQHLRIFHELSKSEVKAYVKEPGNITQITKRKRLPVQVYNENQDYFYPVDGQIEDPLSSEEEEEEVPVPTEEYPAESDSAVMVEVEQLDTETILAYSKVSNPPPFIDLSDDDDDDADSNMTKDEVINQQKPEPKNLRCRKIELSPSRTVKKEPANSINPTDEELTESDGRISRDTKDAGNGEENDADSGICSDPPSSSTSPCGVNDHQQPPEVASKPSKHPPMTTIAVWHTNDSSPNDDDQAMLSPDDFPMIHSGSSQSSSDDATHQRRKRNVRIGGGGSKWNPSNKSGGSVVEFQCPYCPLHKMFKIRDSVKRHLMKIHHLNEIEAQGLMPTCDQLEGQLADDENNNHLLMADENNDNYNIAMEPKQRAQSAANPDDEQGNGDNVGDEEGGDDNRDELNQTNPKGLLLAMMIKNELDDSDQYEEPSPAPSKSPAVTDVIEDRQQIVSACQRIIGSALEKSNENSRMKSAVSRPKGSSTKTGKPSVVNDRIMKSVDSKPTNADSSKTSSTRKSTKISEVVGRLRSFSTTPDLTSPPKAGEQNSKPAQSSPTFPSSTTTSNESTPGKPTSSLSSKSTTKIAKSINQSSSPVHQQKEQNGKEQEEEETDSVSSKNDADGSIIILSDDDEEAETTTTHYQHGNRPSRQRGGLDKTPEKVIRAARKTQKHQFSGAGNDGINRNTVSSSRKRTAEVSFSNRDPAAESGGDRKNGKRKSYYRTHPSSSSDSAKKNQSNVSRKGRNFEDKAASAAAELLPEDRFYLTKAEREALMTDKTADSSNIRGGSKRKRRNRFGENLNEFKLVRI